MFSIVPELTDALVDLATEALPDLLVSDGYSNSAEPRDFLLIGVEDPTSPVDAVTAEETVEYAAYGLGPTGGPREARGDITCRLYCSTGDGEQKPARDAVYAALDALQSAIAADVTLGLSTASRVVQVRMGATHRLLQNNLNGSEAGVVFTINYFTHLS